jgi:hypothetical protein
LFLGDVRGKGAEAASATSLTRYTLRAAALVDADPTAALKALSTALLLDAAVGTRFCTAVLQEPVAGEADCSDLGEVADLDTAGLPGDARVRLSMVVTHPCSPITPTRCTTSRSQIARSCGQSAASSSCHAWSIASAILETASVEFSTARTRGSRADGPVALVATSWRAASSGVARIMARSSAQVWLRPRGGGATKFGPD